MSMVVHAQFTTVLMNRQGPSSQAHYGSIIFGLGDQNSDGYADFAIWAWGLGPLQRPNYTRLEFFHGGNPVRAVPYRTIFADTVNGVYLGSPGPAGDLNGDGFVDWFVVTEYRDEPSVNSLEIYLGGPNAIDTPSAVIRLPGYVRVRAMGDFNGDGYDDLYVSVDDQYGHPYRKGAYFGGNPMDTEPDWTVSGPPGYTDEAELLSFGDLNGDGYSDAVSVNSAPAMLYVFLGSAHPDTVPAITWENFNASPCAIVKDINGDGRDDLLTQGDSLIEVHFGRQIMSRVADLTLHCPAATQSFSSAGDLNGDGYNDFIAYARNDYAYLARTAVIFLGYRWINRNPVFQVYDGSDFPLFTAIGVGDANGDGADDWAVGGYYDPSPGRAIVYSGNLQVHVAADEPRASLPATLELAAFPNPFNPTTTISFTLNTPGRATISVFDLLGRRVEVLTDGHFERGRHQILFDANGIPSGTYLVRLNGNGSALSQKLQLIR